MAHTRDLRLLDRMYKEEVKEGLCDGCSQEPELVIWKLTVTPIPEKNVREEIREVVSKVNANSDTKARLFQVLQKYEVFTEHPRKCNMFIYTIKVNTTYQYSNMHVPYPCSKLYVTKFSHGLSWV